MATVMPERVRVVGPADDPLGAPSCDGERQSRALLDALPVAIYTTDADGRVTYFNEAAAQFWGYRPQLGSDKWCGSWRLYRTDGTPLPHDQCPMAIALKEGRQVRGAEAVAERPDGTRVPFIPFPTPLRDASGTIIGAVNLLVDISDRKAAERRSHEREARLILLAREVDHRAKNLLATVMAMTRMTRAETAAEFAAALIGRLQSLSTAHALLSENRWIGTDLRRLVTEGLAAYGERGGRRMTIDGPALALCSEAAQALAMTMHELATNAVKYGALSVPGGRVSVDWFWSAGEPLILRWTELGGPPTRAPARQGFGLDLIETSITAQLEGSVQFDWGADGLTCRMVIPHERLCATERFLSI
jgi:PAS domain S-box-containing protein